MPNHSERLATNAKAIMARLLLCGAVVAGGSGCLFPQSDQVVPTLPPVKNQPLQIKVSKPAAQPYDFTTGTVPSTPGTPCDPLDFSVSVEDRDLKDDIRSLWFIDKTDVSLPFRPAPVQGTDQLTRTVTQPNSTAFRTAMTSLTTGTHLLTVFVVDTDFDEGVEGTLKPTTTPVSMPDGSEVQEPGSMDSYTWVLNVKPACQ